MDQTVLLLDDEPNVLSALKRLLHREPYDILTAETAEAAAEILDNQPIDLIVSDEEMPGMSGTEFLSRVANDYPDIVGIVLTGHPTLPALLRAINEGNVYQFFTKPCNEIDLALSIRRALEQRALKLKSRELLAVTERQSALIEEARLLRRLRPLPPTDETSATASEAEPLNQSELLVAMDEGIKKGSEVLKAAWDEKSG